MAVACSQVFRRLSTPCTLALVDLLVPIVVLPREYIHVQGMPGDEMFFLSRGLVQVRAFLCPDCLSILTNQRALAPTNPRTPSRAASCR